MLEYLLAASTVVKGFSSYFTTLIGARHHCRFYMDAYSQHCILCIPACRFHSLFMLFYRVTLPVDCSVSRNL
jgi:hypothetical protein